MTITDAPAVVIGSAVSQLGKWAASLDVETVPPSVVEALDRVLGNLLAVAAGGAATADHQALVAAWDPEPGSATLLGSAGWASVETAAWLNGVASVAMERDEGNRATKGHPAAQSFPAVLALAERLGASGLQTRRALLVAYEVAARFGRATVFAPDVHTHGTFGVPGAAAGCAVLLGLDAARIAGAIEAATTLPVSTSWAPVLGGSAVRDQWVGAANVAGLASARFAAVSRPRIDTLGDDFGGALGVTDPVLIVDGLGDDWMIEHGYFKRYSSCAYTHGPADSAVIARRLLAESGRSLADVVAIECHLIGKGVELDSTTWTTPHGAFFSVPFAIASALVHGDVAYERSSAESSAALRGTARLVRLVDGAAASPRLGPFDAMDPTSRPSRLVLHFRKGDPIVVDSPHPRGDQDLTPFAASVLADLIDEAVGGSPVTPAAVNEVVARLRDTGPFDLRPLAHPIPDTTPRRETRNKEQSP